VKAIGMKASHMMAGAFRPTTPITKPSVAARL